jgi:hypothetical protein
MADLATRLSAISAEGKLACAQVVHAKMEEGIVLFLVMPLLDLCVHAKVHVPVYCRVVMPYRYALRCGEEVCKVARSRGDGVDWQRYVVVLGNMVVWNMVEVVCEVFFRGVGVCLDRGPGDVGWGRAVRVVYGRKVRHVVALNVSLNVSLLVRYGRIGAAVFAMCRFVGAIAVASTRRGGAVARLVVLPMHVLWHDMGGHGRAVMMKKNWVLVQN